MKCLISSPTLTTDASSCFQRTEWPLRGAMCLANSRRDDAVTIGETIHYASQGFRMLR